MSQGVLTPWQMLTRTKLSYGWSSHLRRFKDQLRVQRVMSSHLLELQRIYQAWPLRSLR